MARSAEDEISAEPGVRLVAIARGRSQVGPDRYLWRRGPYGLTPREFMILRLLADGMRDKDVAQELEISPLTVHRHVLSIRLKMKVTSRAEAAERAVKEGFLG